MSEPRTMPVDDAQVERAILVNPSKAELQQAQLRFNLHPLIIGDLLAGRQQPKFERFEEHLYISIWDMSGKRYDSSGIDCDLALIFNERVLLLVQRGPEDDLRDLNTLVNATGPLPDAPPTISAVYRVLDAVVADFIALGATVEKQLDEVEAEVFDSRVHEDFAHIYQLRQRIGEIDRASTGLATALRSARQPIHAATGSSPALRPYFLHLEHDAAGVSELASAEHASLDAVVSSHESNVGTRQNQDMRTISAFAALLAIPTVLAGIYGMNFKNLPLVHWEYGWLAVAVAIIVIDVVAYIAFRRRGWLGGAARHIGRE